ncbi:hypothetical protein [Paraliobacillus salinarum]|uniref:hypothetical protein n=1 Tax=Paraliobacillus salinarum TaxID=1158996 RepID=UPI0015F39C61|nr:hypothetical protein [Paraliobacillus salinarum]
MQQQAGNCLHATFKIIDTETDEIVHNDRHTYVNQPYHFIVEHTKRKAYEIARDLGYDEVAK